MREAVEVTRGARRRRGRRGEEAGEKTLDAIVMDRIYGCFAVL